MIAKLFFVTPMFLDSVPAYQHLFLSVKRLPNNEGTILDCRLNTETYVSVGACST